MPHTECPGPVGLLCDLDEFDVALEERVDEVVEFDALGFSACGEIVAHTGLQIHGHIEYGILAEEVESQSMTSLPDPR